MNGAQVLSRRRSKRPKRPFVSFKVPRAGDGRLENGPTRPRQPGNRPYARRAAFGPFAHLYWAAARGSGHVASDQPFFTAGEYMQRAMLALAAVVGIFTVLYDSA